MSAIVLFDIRNFSTHVSHLAAGNKGNTERIFKVVKEIFRCLDHEIRSSYKVLVVDDKKVTHLIHTGDGFVAIFYGKGRCLQGLTVACLLGQKVQKIFSEYNKDAKTKKSIKTLPSLDYGIGVHVGSVKKFDFCPVYPSQNEFKGIGLLGHAINLASRVQDSTKDHNFNIICTQRVYDDAIITTSEKNKKEVERCFSNLGEHKLKGMRKLVPLYGVNVNLGNQIIQ